MIPAQTAARIEASGWCRFPADAASLAWARAAFREGQAVLADPDQRARHLVCEGTWFVGVDALPTAPDGSIAGVPLGGPAIRALSPLPALHRAQLSVTFPGYPRPRSGESAAGFRYRQTRDAAHVDGILAEGPGRRRYLREPHGWILGLPLTPAEAGASPLVVWEGSHQLMRAAFRAALGPLPPDSRTQADVTDIYTRTRRRVFETCRRVVVTGDPGEAFLLHPMLLHGVAPWTARGAVPVPGRMTAYFRPCLPSGTEGWLSL